MAGYSPKTLERAKAMRRELTPQERLLWNRIRNRQLGNFKFRKQQPLGHFIGDFVCHDQKLVIEADGSQHFESNYDVGRNKWMEDRGYSVLRFWNNEINDNLDGVLTTILNVLSQNPSPTSPKQ